MPYFAFIWRLETLLLGWGPLNVMSVITQQLIVSLGRHKMLHTGEKPFSCTLCNYKARQGGHLTRHMLSHSMPVQSVTTAQLWKAISLDTWWPTPMRSCLLAQNVTIKQLLKQTSLDTWGYTVTRSCLDTWGHTAMGCSLSARSVPIDLLKKVLSPNT